MIKLAIGNSLRYDSCRLLIRQEIIAAIKPKTIPQQADSHIAELDMKLWSSLRLVFTVMLCLLFELNRKAANKIDPPADAESKQDNIINKVVESGRIVFPILS